MTLHIYDGMAVLRRRLDTDPLGRAPRGVVTEQLNAQAGDLHVWAFEGQGSLSERRKALPGYKVRKSTMTDGLHAMVNLIRDALKHTKALQVAVPGREADDVIAHMVEAYAGRMPIVVHTVDRDLHALAIHPGVTVKAEPFKEPLAAEHVRLFKTYCGDSSDKIPGMTGFGPKAWAACDPRRLAAAHDQLLAFQPDAAAFEAAGVKPGMAARICAPEQAALLRTYWDVVGFLPMPSDWGRFVVTGKLDPSAADALLRQYMH